MKNIYLVSSVAVCAASARELSYGRFLFSAILLAGAFILLIKGGAADPEEERDEKSRLENPKRDK